MPTHSSRTSKQRSSFGGKDFTATFQAVHYSPPIVIKTKYHHRIISDITTCLLVADDGEMGMGLAACSIFDKFDKGVGAKLAFTRALELTDVPREKRGIYWQEFFKALPR